MSSAESVSSAEKEILNECNDILQNGDIGRSLNKLNFFLWKKKQTSSVEDWRNFSTRTCREHDILNTIHKSPISQRAYHKPRGYAGDAVLMDFVYGIDQDISSNPIYSWEFELSGSKSVRTRREFMSQYINFLAQRNNNLNILSAACGHLREAMDINDEVHSNINSFFALDCDAKSLSRIDESKFVKVNASVIDFVRRKLDFPELDLVYSLGLFDYLNDKLATRLVKEWFKILKAGGRMVLANFAPNLVDIAYMEAYMDWYLIYRDEFDMEKLTFELPANSYRLNTFRDIYKNIVFLEITKI